jgi:hypothetical protein
MAASCNSGEQGRSLNRRYHRRRKPVISASVGWNRLLSSLSNGRRIPAQAWFAGVAAIRDRIRAIRGVQPGREPAISKPADAISGLFESGSEILRNRYVCLLQQFQKTSSLVRHYDNFRIALGWRRGTVVGIKISALMTFRSGTM